MSQPDRRLPLPSDDIGTGGPARVRPAAADDLDAIRALFVEALDREPIQRAALADLLFHRPPGESSLRLVADANGVIVGCAFGSVHDGVGFVDAIAVADPMRRHRIATTLLTSLERRLHTTGARSLKVGGNTSYYAWPGVDLAYTAALCLFERAGYRRMATVSNMTVRLDTWNAAAVAEIDTDVAVRRASAADSAALDSFVRTRFTEVWAHEARLAVHRAKPTVFVAVQHGDVVGFACHGVYRAGWFGPLGVEGSQRGNGVGEALLRHCLDDLATAGLAEAQITWIGPARFYSNTVGARCERTFALLEKHR